MQSHAPTHLALARVSFRSLAVMPPASRPRSPTSRGVLDFDSGLSSAGAQALTLFIPRSRRRTRAGRLNPAVRLTGNFAVSRGSAL